jgi:hypothetical protein
MHFPQRSVGQSRLLHATAAALFLASSTSTSSTPLVASSVAGAGVWPWRYSGFDWFPSWWGPAGRKDGPEAASYQPLIARHQVSGWYAAFWLPSL